MPAKRLRLPAEALNDTRDFTRRSSPSFIARWRPSPEAGPRFMVIVGAKTDPTSAGRHLLKRRVAERLRLRQGKWDMIVTVLPAAKGLPRKAFLQELDKLLP